MIDQNCKIQKLDIGNSVLFLLSYDANFDEKQYLDQLTPTEIERYFGFKHEKRKKEFVATRLLKNNFLGANEIKYNVHGAPYLDELGFISISHANRLVGIALQNNFQIGLDLEEIHPKVLKIYKKFVNSSEEKLFNTNNTEDLITCWSLKESLYKLAGRKLIDFKNHLTILERNNNNFKASINLDDKKIICEMQAQKINNYIITYNSSQTKLIHHDTF